MDHMQEDCHVSLYVVMKLDEALQETIFSSDSIESHCGHPHCRSCHTYLLLTLITADTLPTDTNESTHHNLRIVQYTGCYSLI